MITITCEICKKEITKLDVYLFDLMSIPGTGLIHKHCKHEQIIAKWLE